MALKRKRDTETQEQIKEQPKEQIKENQKRRKTHQQELQQQEVNHQESRQQKLELELQQKLKAIPLHSQPTLQPILYHTSHTQTEDNRRKIRQQELELQPKPKPKQETKSKTKKTSQSSHGTSRGTSHVPSHVAHTSYHPLQHYSPTTWLRGVHRCLLSLLHTEIHTIIFDYATEIELEFLYVIRPSWNESLENPINLSVFRHELFVGNKYNSHINSGQIVVFDVDTGRYLRSWPAERPASICVASGGVFVTRSGTVRGLSYYHLTTGCLQLLPLEMGKDLIYVSLSSSTGLNNEEYLWTVGYEGSRGLFDGFGLLPGPYYVDQWRVNRTKHNHTISDGATCDDNVYNHNSCSSKSTQWIRRWVFTSNDKHWEKSEFVSKYHVKKVVFDQDELFVLFHNYEDERSMLEIFKSKKLFSSDSSGINENENKFIDQDIICQAYPWCIHDERKEPSESEVVWREYEHRCHKVHDLIVNGNQIISTHNVNVYIRHRDTKRVTSLNIFQSLPKLLDDVEPQGLAISNNRLFVAISGNMCINVYT